MSATQSKKPFDKKKWREKTYNKKFKIQQWEERRKKVIMRQYLKELKRIKAENSSIHTAPLTTSSHEDNSTKKNKLSVYQLAQLEFEKKKQEKQQRREEAERRKAEKQEALQKYRLKKMERYKQLSKKTKKGQPVMKGRIEMLLEKIQNECGTSK